MSQYGTLTIFLHVCFSDDHGASKHKAVTLRRYHYVTESHAQSLVNDWAMKNNLRDLDYKWQADIVHLTPAT